MSNVKEVKARDGRVFALVTEGDTTLPVIAAEVLFVPRTSELPSLIVNIVPLQLLTDSIADLRGADIDQPRTLAKSITVEKRRVTANTLDHAGPSGHVLVHLLGGPLRLTCRCVLARLEM